MAEGVYFYYILSKEVISKKSDLIVVFTGDTSRIEIGYTLAHKGYAPYLVISSANEEELRKLDERYSLPLGVKHIVEDRARTTFENTLFTKKIIDEYKLEFSNFMA